MARAHGAVFGGSLESFDVSTVCETWMGCFEGYMIDRRAMYGYVLLLVVWMVTVMFASVGTLVSLG